MKALTIVLPKGRLLTPALELFEAIGLHPGPIRQTRKLIVEDEKRQARFILLKPADVLTFVEYGAADLGIVGQDILREQGADVFESRVLPFGYCHLALATRRASPAPDWRSRSSFRVATKYARLTREYFSARGASPEIIPVHSSVELAPALGLADWLVDVVDTGRTLNENGLVECETVMQSQAALIVNRASYTLRFDEIAALFKLIDARAEAVSEARIESI